MCERIAGADNGEHAESEGAAEEKGDPSDASHRVQYRPFPGAATTYNPRRVFDPLALAPGLGAAKIGPGCAISEAP